MKKAVLPGISVGLAVMLILAYWVFKEKPTELENAWYRQPVEQSVSERIWREIEFEKIAVIEDHLHRPYMLKSYDEDAFLVTDYGDMIVKKINYTGEPVAHYGKGEGRGPGEMLSILDVQVDENGKIWVLDSTNLRITVFNSPDEWRIIELPEPTSRLIPADSNRFIVKPRFSENPEMWHANGSVLNKYEPLVRDPLLWAYIHDGFMEKDPFGGIIRNLLYSHTILRYNASGEIDYFRRAIDPPSLAEIMENIDEPRRYDDEQTLFFREISPFSRLPRFDYTKIKGSEIHALLSFTTDEVVMSLPEGDIHARERRFVDVYDVITGDYRYSYRLPEPVSDIAFSGDFFATISSEDGRVSVWRWREK